MKKEYGALIFDMDGVLIDSEHLWRKAMISGFESIGIPFTEDDCRKTTGMRFKEVVEIWLKTFRITDIPVKLVEERVLAQLIQLINTEGKAIEGVKELYRFAKERGWKTGLATSSYQVLVDTVLNRLEMTHAFDAVVSAEKMRYGKPHPEVFLKCAEELGISPEMCIVIEDSINGVIAAKAAQMTVYTVPDVDHKFNKQFGVADRQCENMQEVLRLFKEIIPAPVA